MSKLFAQYGKQSNQPVNMAKVTTFYSKQDTITFVFDAYSTGEGKYTHLWRFTTYTEAQQVYAQLLEDFT